MCLVAGPGWIKVLISYLVLDPLASGALAWAVGRGPVEKSIGHRAWLGWGRWDPDAPSRWSTPVPPLLHADQADRIPTSRPIFAIYVDARPWRVEFLHGDMPQYEQDSHLFEDEGGKTMPHVVLVEAERCGPAYQACKLVGCLSFYLLA